MLDTLGDVVMCFLVVAAVIIVPAAIARAWWPVLKREVVGLFIMSREAETPTEKTGMDLVCIPVSHTSMDGGMEDDFEMPRIGRRLSDEEIITVLATQKGIDGAKYRFTANEIALLLKGDRNTRLDQIRAVREGPPAPQVREHQAKLEQLQSK